MNKFISRIICVCLTCCLLFCFTFNVSATSDFYSINWLDYATLNDEGSNYINLTSNDGEFIYFSPFKERMYASELLVKLSGTSDRVTSLVIVDEDGTSYTAQKLYLGSGYYRFLWNCDGNVIESLTFQFTLNTDSTTYCSVMQLRSSAYDVLYFAPKYDAHVSLSDANGTITQFPFLSTNSFNTNDDHPGLAAESYRIDINMSDWKKYDFIDFAFSVVGHNVMSVYCVVNQKVQVPITVEEIYSNTSTVNGLVNNFTVSCDLTSVPKEGLLTLIIRGAASSDDKSNSAFSCSCSSATGMIKSDSFTNPLYYWLAELTSNTSGLSAALGIINNAIVSAKTSLGNAITNGFHTMQTTVDSMFTFLRGNFTSFKAFMESQFNDLFSNLSSILNPEDAEDAPADLQDSLADQNDQLVSIDQELNSVEKVDPDDLNISLDSFVSQDHLNLATSGLSNILGNEIILQVLIMSITFAMVGYILFGKR